LKILSGSTATKALPVAVLLAAGLKCPDAQAARNDHADPGAPHWYVKPSDLHRPLIEGPHNMKNGYYAEENT